MLLALHHLLPVHPGFAQHLPMVDDAEMEKNVLIPTHCSQVSVRAAGQIEAEFWEEKVFRHGGQVLACQSPYSS